jgi:hypothetical protein
MKIALVLQRLHLQKYLRRLTMEVDSIGEKGLVRGPSNVKDQRLASGFSQVLRRRMSSADGIVNPPPERVEGKEKPGVESGGKSEWVNLGTISRKAQTVSDLLLRHPTYKKDIWRIIHSELNQNKPYKKMQVGTRVSLNTRTHEISWDSLSLRHLKRASSGYRRTASYGIKSGALGERPALEGQEGPEWVNLGTISHKTQTVSDLLLRHPVYKREMWKIVHSELNNNRPYTKMRPGTKVYLNPQSLEIMWQGQDVNIQRSQALDGKDHTLSENSYGGVNGDDPISDGLVKAIQPYVGKPYDQVDCFQLVVEGLERLGVRYKGRGGLGERLIKMATKKGLPSNAYLNGEGLIKASGSEVYSKSILKVRNSETQARDVYKEMEPLLRKGFILSFSTPTRGHTGIVSQKDRSWTYINSGEMDHQIQHPSASKRVGEEYLTEEIKNWLALAEDRNESLVITLGQLKGDKLRGRTI